MPVRALQLMPSSTRPPPKSKTQPSPTRSSEIIYDADSRVTAGLGYFGAMTAAQAKSIAQAYAGTYDPDGHGLYALLSALDPNDRQAVINEVLAAGVDSQRVNTVAWKLSLTKQPAKPAPWVHTGTFATVWSVAQITSGLACTYHGYKRNDSIGWAIVWGLLGTIFCPITPVIAVAQGFGKRKKG